MAINFPASPSTNDIHQVGNQIWFWNATYWELKSNVTKFSSQDAAPSSPLDGDIWYETDTGKLFIRYDSYWVEIGHGSDGQSFIVSETTPASTTTGDIWYESDTGKTFIYYDSYWVEIGHASDTDMSDYALIASPTFTGNVTMQSLDMDTIVAGDVIYGSGADTLARLAKGSNDEVLTLASGIPSWEALPSSGISWSGSTSNGLATYGSGSSVVAEPNATYDGNTLALTSASSQNLQVVTTGANSNAQMKFQNDARHYNVGIAGTDSDKFNFRDETASSTHLAIHSNGIVGLETSGGGLKLDGLNSSDANTLDDYEEGTSTGLILASTSGTMTLAADQNTLAYVRIGRLVFVQGTLELTSVSSPLGTLRVGGLPFTIANDIAMQGDRGGINTFVIYMATAVTRGLYMHNVSGQTYYDINEGDGSDTLAYQLANQVDGGTKFIVSGSYYAAA